MVRKKSSSSLFNCKIMHLALPHLVLRRTCHLYPGDNDMHPQDM